MNPLATELNAVIERSNPHVLEMLSDMGKHLFFPKGILTQSAEAKEKAHQINATIGIAKQAGHVMALPSIVSRLEGVDPDEYLPYAPSFGKPAIREAWKSALLEKNPSLSGKPISLPVVTGGITHGISTFADLWIGEGDTVILPDMMWGNYNMTFSVRNRAQIVHYNAYTPDQSQMDLDDFERVVMEQSKKCDKIITVFNFPHNPTGYTVTDAEADRMADILIKVAQNGTNVVVGCDDAYFGLVFEESAMKESIFTRLAGADKRIVAVKLDGATKEDYVWGLRIGFLTYGLSSATDANDLDALYLALEKKSAGCIRGSVSNISNLSQTIVLKSMEDEKYNLYKDEKYKLLKERADTIKAVLKDSKYREAFAPYPFNSGYFMCIRLTDPDIDAEMLRLHLLNHYGIGLISIGSRNLRVAFSCLEKDQVTLLFDMILKGVNELKVRK